jgi:hypothetical protein
MHHVVKAAVVAALVVCGLSAPRPAAAYSVLAHEANIDALWDSTIAPMLVARFPGANREILVARGYAYGGCVIQDLGYYPFGSHFFSNLLHYVRTGDDTYDELLGKLADRAFADVPKNLRSHLVAYYGDVDSLPDGTDAQRKQSARIRKQLGLLDAVKRP